MSKLIILTNTYPYYPGEEFFESEMPHIEGSSFNEIMIVPMSATEKKRKVAPHVEVSKPVWQVSFLIKLLHLPLVVCNPVFIKELGYLMGSKKLSAATLLRALTACLRLHIVSKKLSNILDSVDDDILLYCYWNEVPSYAACSMKKINPLIKVVSRAHGYDIYQERYENDYMPLKRQFVSCFDKVFVLSEQAKNYYINTYDACAPKVGIARLGVTMPAEKTNGGKNGCLHLVSLSRCHPVKRIDKIIRGIAEFAKNNPGVDVEWHHIGEGELFDELSELAQKTLGFANVTYNFLGYLSNTDVLQYLSSNSVDAIINASESEGVPVSIMEAMSFGVPAIAPMLGGIPDLVTDETGYMLPENVCVNDIVKALTSLANDENKAERRERARAHINEHFNADKNYAQFVHGLESFF